MAKSEQEKSERLQMVYLVATMIERNEWVYVTRESLLEASILVKDGAQLIEVEEDELNDQLIVRLPEGE
tara:strand:+ start:5457 stop:5663 length:207 start_codon:yes stop_codon:yes gene_type:complete